LPHGKVNTKSAVKNNIKQMFVCMYFNSSLFVYLYNLLWLRLHFRP